MTDFSFDCNLIKSYVDKLNKWTEAYDYGKPIVSDEEWDEIYFKLQMLEKKTGIHLPNSPTNCIYFNVVDKLKKVEHDHPMLSLDKTKDIADILKFIGNKEVIAMLKMDGLTCSLKYLDGKLIQAETRGNGTVGEDILHNAMTIWNIPKIIPYKEELVVDGEIICKTDIFENRFSAFYKNPRNYAAGAIRRLNAKENEDAGLSFVAWDLIKGIPAEDKTLEDKLDTLDNIGFTTVSSCLLKEGSKEKDIENSISLLKDLSKLFNYPIDGIVFKYNDIEYYQSLGVTNHHFRGGLAFKFYDESYETELVDIEWSLGRTGQITPVAIYKPIDIDGSICNRASLHNISVMKDTLHNTPYKGQKIKVAKMNMIIPQIVEADSLQRTEATEKNNDLTIPIPKICPICKKELTIKNDNGIEVLYCMNIECGGKLSQKINHYCSKAKGLDIKGLSLMTIEKLIEWGWLNSIEDIYSLKNHKEEWIKKPGFGEKSVTNILTAIENSKTCEWNIFISALGIPLISIGVSKELAKIFSDYNDFRQFIKNLNTSFVSFDGFGEEMNNALKNFDYDEADRIARLLSFKEKTSKGNEQKLKDKIIVITGKLNTVKNRQELTNLIEENGGKVSSSVTSKTSFLINNDITSQSSKNQKAKSLGIPIVTEENFLKNLIS